MREVHGPRPARLGLGVRVAGPSRRPHRRHHVAQRVEAGCELGLEARLPRQRPRDETRVPRGHRDLAQRQQLLAPRTVSSCAARRLLEALVGVGEQAVAVGVPGVGAQREGAAPRVARGGDRPGGDVRPRRLGPRPRRRTLRTGGRAVHREGRPVSRRDVGGHRHALEHLGDARVHRGQRRRVQRGAQDSAHRGVREGQRRPVGAGAGGLDEDAVGHEPGAEPRSLGGPEGVDEGTREVGLAERAPAQQRAACRRHGVDARGQHLVEGAREQRLAALVRREVGDDLAVAVEHRPGAHALALVEGLDDLEEREGVAADDGAHLGDERVAGVVRAERLRDELAPRLEVEGTDGDLGHAAELPLHRVVVAQREHHQHRRRRRTAREVGEQRAARVVGELEAVDEQHHRRFAGRRREQRPQHQRELADDGSLGEGLGGLEAEAHPQRPQRRAASEGTRAPLISRALERRLEARFVEGLRRGAAVPRHDHLEELRHQREGRSARAQRALDAKHARAAVDAAKTLGEGSEHRRLARAELAHDAPRGAHLARDDGVERLAQRRQRTLPSKQREALHLGGGVTLRAPAQALQGPRTTQRGPPRRRLAEHERATHEAGEGGPQQRLAGARGHGQGLGDGQRVVHGLEAQRRAVGVEDARHEAAREAQRERRRELEERLVDALEVRREGVRGVEQVEGEARGAKRIIDLRAQHADEQREAVLGVPLEGRVGLEGDAVDERREGAGLRRPRGTREPADEHGDVEPLAHGAHGLAPRRTLVRRHRRHHHELGHGDVGGEALGGHGARGVVQRAERGGAHAPRSEPRVRGSVHRRNARPAPRWAPRHHLLEPLLRRRGFRVLLGLVQVRVQREEHRLRRREAVLAARAHRTAHDGAQGLGRFRREHVGIGQTLLTHLREQRLRVGHVGEPRPPGEHLEQQHAQREDVGAPVHGLAARLLRGHVPVLALHEPALERRRRARVRDAEITELHRPLVGEQHVRRRHVAVHDLERTTLLVEALVRVVQRPREVSEDQRRHHVRHALARAVRHRQEQPEVRAVDVLHDEQQRRAVGLEAVHLHQVRVVQAHRDPRLVHEHRAEVRVLREIREDALHHQGLVDALGAAGPREEHLGHPADAEASRHEVAAEAVGTLDGHPALRRRMLRQRTGRRYRFHRA